MNFNQNDELPFNPLELEVQPIEFSMQNPPYMPSHVQCVPELENYVGACSALLANEIQSKATANHASFLRIFMYNQCAPNYFATDTFDALISATLDYVTYMLTDPVSISNPSIENALGIAVPDMVYMLAADNCRTYQRLGDNVPREMVGTIKELLQKYDFLAKEIANMKNGGSKSQNSRIGNRTGFGMGTNNQARRASFGGGGTTATRTSFGSNTTRSKESGLFSASGSSSGASFGRNNNASGFGKPAQQVTKVSLAAAKQLAPVNKPAGQYNQPNFNKGKDMPQTEQVEQDEVTDIPYSEEKWVPSARFPYFPAFRPSAMALTYDILDDGSTKPKLKKVIPDMDFDRHKIPSVFGSVPESFDLSSTAKNLVRIQKGAVMINSESALLSREPAEGETPPLVTYHSEGVLTTTSLTEAWLNMQLKRLAAEATPDVFRGMVRIITPVIVGEGEEEVISNFGRCMTYIGLREQLDASFSRISPELYHAINSRITQAVNRSIRVELGIEKLAMSDFRADITEMMEIIEARYGKNVLAAFKNCQEAHIKEATAMEPSDSFKEIADSFVDGFNFGEGKAPKIVGMYANYSLTLVNCYAHDLELELGANGIGTSVTKEVVPEVFDLVTGIFNSPGADQQHRHLVRTNDGRLLEAAMGALGDEHYLLALVE